MSAWLVAFDLRLRLLGPGVQASQSPLCIIVRSYFEQVSPLTIPRYGPSEAFNHSLVVRTGGTAHMSDFGLGDGRQGLVFRR